MWHQPLLAGGDGEEVVRSEIVEKGGRPSERLPLA
jgi:hypothetical protein